MMLKLMMFVLLIGFVSGVSVDFDCDEDIYAGEEFECEVEVSDGDGRYDLKVEVDDERDSVLRIFCEERGWISGYYYLTDFVRDDAEVRLRVEEIGRYDVVVKLRDGDWREEFEVGRLKVGEREDNEVALEELEGRNSGTQMNADYADFGDEDVGVISLGGEDEVVLVDKNGVMDEEWDYVSKDGMIVDWLLYAFCLFLIFLVGVLGWDKLSNRY